MHDDGHDPLLANPARPTGETDAIRRPGDTRPEWLIPVLAIAFGSLIAGLVIFGQSDGRAGDAVPATVSSVGDMPTTSAEAAGSAGAAGSLPTASATPAVPEAGPAGSGGTDVEPPPPGSIRVGDATFPLLRSCRDHLPLAPNSADERVSSYLFSPDGERPQVVERWFAADGTDGVRIDGLGADGLATLAVDDLDDTGAFAATMERPDGLVVDLVLAPPPDDRLDCSETVVTNEPAQFAFPYTRVVMETCVQEMADGGRSITGITSEGARFVATQPGGGGAEGEVRLRTIDMDPDGSEDLVDVAAELFVDGDVLGWSGRVANGSDELDITIDVDVARSRPCDDQDRL